MNSWSPSTAATTLQCWSQGPETTNRISTNERLARMAGQDLGCVLPSLTESRCELGKLDSGRKNKKKKLPFKNNVASTALRRMKRRNTRQGLLNSKLNDVMSTNVETVDFSYCNLRDADIVAVTCALQANPSIRYIDVSFNDLTDTGAKLLLDLLSTSRQIISINVSGTGVSLQLALSIDEAGKKNMLYQEKRQSNRNRKAAIEARKHNDAEIELLLQKVFIDQQTDYRIIKSDYQQQFFVLHKLMEQGVCKIVRKQRLHQKRANHELRKKQLFTSQHKERIDTFNNEQLLFGFLFIKLEQQTREIIFTTSILGYKELKSHEKREWTFARRGEKMRFMNEASVRQDLQQNENQNRSLTETQELDSWLLISLTCTENFSECQNRIQKRREEEIATQHRKEVEGRRLNYEKNLKREREQQEEQRKLAIQHYERTVIENKEKDQRVSVTHHEDVARIAYSEMSSVNLKISKSRSDVSVAESLLLASWSAAPVITLTHRIDTDQSGSVKGTARVVYQSPIQPPVSLNLTELHISHAAAKNAEADCSFKNERNKVSQIRNNLKEDLIWASQTVRAKNLRWQESILFGGIPQDDNSKITSSPLLTYCLNDKSLEEPSWLCSDSARLIIKGGSVTVSANTSSKGTHVFEIPYWMTSDPRFSSSRITSSDVTVPIPNNSEIEFVLSIINSILYKFKGSNNTNISTNSFNIQLTLLYPSLSKKVSSSGIYHSVEEAFSDVVAVKCGATYPFIISPVLIKLQSDNAIDWIEEHDETQLPEDKGASIFYYEGMPNPDPTIAMCYHQNGSVNGTVSGPIDGCTLQIRVSDNCTSLDRIVLKTGLFCDDYSNCDRNEMSLSQSTKQLSSDGLNFATVSGLLLTLKEAVDLGSQPPTASASVPVVITFCKGSNLSFLQRTLRRLRFIILTPNMSASQEQRIIELTHTDSFGNSFRVLQRINVIPSDKPTTLYLKFNKIYSRIPSLITLPHHYRDYVQPCRMAVFPQADLIDVDTNNICGGSLTIELTKSYKGDTLFVNQSNVEHVRVADSCIYYGSTLFAILDKGYTDPPVFDTRNDESDLSKSKSFRRFSRSSQKYSRRRSSVANIKSESDDAEGSHIRVQFVTNGSATLAAIQALIRCISFSNSYFVPMTGTRDLLITLKLGPPATSNTVDSMKPTSYGQYGHTESDFQELSECIELKITLPILEMPISHCVVAYREGSPPVRLAPIDIHHELHPTEVCFDGGFVRVEVVKGASSDDCFSMKSGLKDSIRVTPRKREDGFDQLPMPGIGHPLLPGDVPLLPPPIRNPPKVTTAVPKKQPEPSGLTSNTSFRETPTNIERQGSIVSLKKKATRFVKAAHALTAASELSLMVRIGDELGDVWHAQKHIGTLYHQRSQIIIKLAPKLQKKDVTACLRSLAYHNISNGPKELTKIIRVTASDSGGSFSQVILQLDITPVDDVTEIVIPQQRIKYRPGLEHVQRTGCFALLGLQYATVIDPDTQWFDGGRLIVEFSGGGVKGDALGIMTYQQQSQTRSILLTEGQEGYPDNIICEQSMLYTDDDIEIGSVEMIKSSFPGVQNMRIQFSLHEEPIVSKELVAHILNSTTYTTSQERLTAGQRTFNIRISDLDNPEEGKVKFTIDVHKPLLTAVGSKSEPFTSHKIVIPGQPILISDRFQIAPTEGKQFNSGFTSITITERAEGDELLLPTSSKIKDGMLFHCNECLGPVTVSNQLGYCRIEHQSTSIKLLSQFMQSIQLHCSELGCCRTVECLCCGGGDPSLITTCFQVSES